MSFIKIVILCVFSFSVLFKQIPGYEVVGSNIKNDSLAVLQKNEFEIWNGEQNEQYQEGNVNSSNVPTPSFTNMPTITVIPTSTPTNVPTIKPKPTETQIKATIPDKATNGITIDEGDDLSKWSENYNAYLAIDTNNCVSGGESLKISSINASKDYFSIEKHVKNLFEEGDMENFEININIPDISKISSVGIAFFNDDINYVKYFSNFIGSYELSNGWNKIQRSKSNFKASVAKADWGKVKCMRLTFYTTGSETVTINLDRTAYNVKGVPKLMFTFEDGYYEVLNNAYPILNSKGFKANVMSIKNRAEVEDPNYLDISELNYLYNSGWDIGNHTETQPESTAGHTKETKRSEYLNCQNWLLQNGWTRGAYHVSYPTFFHDSEIVEIVKSIGAKTAKGDIYGIQSLPAEDIYNMKSIKIGKDISIDLVKSEIDRAISTGSTIILTVHKVVDDPSSGFEVSKEYFNTLVDYIYKKTSFGSIDVVTISQWYDGYLGTAKN